jgi:hypothetical protein
MKTLLATLIALAPATVATPVSAQEYQVGYYSAFIGTEDLYNSSGTRLDSAEAILQQDRANVHRFGIVQRGDESDPWFHQREARGAMPRMFRAGGGISPGTARLIRQGNVPVFVTIYAIDGNFTSLRVEVPG